MSVQNLVRRSPIYYGWIVWGVATLGMIATSPGQSFTVSLFFNSFIHDFELSRTAVSSLYGLGTLIASLGLTWVGRQVDRIGNRTTTLIIIVLFVLALGYMSLVTGPLMLFFGFLMIRGLGQGSLSLVSSTAIAQWFNRRRGMVMSLTVVAFALFQYFYVPAVQTLVAENDWREVWRMLSVGVAIILLPLTLMFLYNRPEDFGLLPDGDSEDAVRESAMLFKEDNWTLHDAMRTPIFWVFNFGRLLPASWGTGLIVHQVSIFAELGYDAEGTTAAATFANFALVAAAVALGSGVLIDRFSAQIVMAIQLLALAVSIGVAMVMTTPVLLGLYVVSFAITMGIGGVFDGAVWTNLYGRKFQGTIRGFATTAMIFGSAIGPVIFGLSFDELGDYNAALIIGVMLSALTALASLLVSAPKRSE